MAALFFQRPQRFVLKDRLITRAFLGVSLVRARRMLVMKYMSLSLAVVLCRRLTVMGQAPTTVKVIGCLQGDGSDQKPWVLSGVALPPPPAAAPAGGGGGGAGRGGG